MKANPTWSLTTASLKMFIRDKQALFFTFFLPFLIMVLFGVFNFGAFGTVDLGIVDQAHNRASQGLIDGLRNVKSLNVTLADSLDEQLPQLKEGKREVVLVLPPGFGESRETKVLQLFYNQGRGAEAQVGQSIIREALDSLTYAITETQPLFTIDAQPVASRNLRYIDFLLPGVVAMSIMQMGIFGVTFSFVQFKRAGILRRLLATPVHPFSFLFAQIFTRLLISAGQTVVLIGVGVLLFDVHVVGSFGLIFLLALVGGAVFLCIGFIIAGFAKTEDAAAPIANLVSMPMMFLSGVFFPRDATPALLRAITKYLPLTYLADGIRQVSTEGASLLAVGGDLVGLAAWLGVSFIVAVRFFRWE